MNFVPVITHAVAILLGWLVVSFASISTPVDGAGSSGGSKATASGSRSARNTLHASPASLLAAQASTSMHPGDRLLLKRRILMDWATTNPDGLLRYLKDRPWLSLVENTNAATLAMETMAKTRPADLLAYAKREGCEIAMGILFRQGDPRLVLEHINSLHPGYFSSDVFGGVLGELFERGCALDPNFHHRLNLIEDPATRVVVFAHVAGILLKANRHDELFAWFSNQDDPTAKNGLLDALASQIVRTESDVTIIADLPEPLQKAAIESTLRSLASALPYPPPEEHHQRASLTALLESGWLDSQVALAAEVITASYFPPDPDRQVQHADPSWKNWALDLPADPKWHPLRRTAIRRWALQNPDQWNTITELPTDDLRNAAYTAVVHNIDTEKNAEQLPWILQQITDPALRNVAAEVITARIEDDPDRPINIDPFRPLGVR